MTKHLRFLFVMLLAMIWSAGWAAIGDNFKLVTDAKDLKAGDKIIIGSKASNVVLGADNGSNKRTAVSATFSSDGVVAWKEGFDVITLEGTASAWYLHSEAGYLYVAAKKTDLKTASDLASVTNNAAVAVITITNNNASISFTISESGRYIFYNTTNKVFGHYKKTNTTTSQIYKLVDSSDTKTSTTLSFNTNETEFSVEKTCEASFTAPTATVKDADGKVVEGAKITYASSNSNIASVDEYGKVTFGSEIGTATITASYAGDDTYKPAESISYTIKYSKIPTVMAWSESVVNVNLGETFTAPTLTFTAHDKNILEGKTIQYNSSDENVAMIDETGIVLMGKAGSAKISATFAGDDTYEAASAEYTLNVIDPNKTDVTFDFTDPEKYGYEKPTTTTKNIILSDGDKLVSSSVTITNVKGGSTTTRFSNRKASFVTLRAYDGAILTVEAPAGFAINRIDFTDDGSQTVDNFTFSTGELKLETWTGLAKNLTMTVDKNQVFLKNMTVNLVKLVELDENSESNTIEAKTGVNVTLKRTMVANEWNTICLPFDVSKEKAQKAFGEGVKIAQLDDKNSTGNTLKFVNMTDCDMEATVPYLIKPSKENTSNEYVFENVNVVADDINKKYETTEGYLVFKGIYNMMDITKDVVDNVDATYYAAFIGDGNKIYKAGTGKTKGFRAYFAIPNDAAASALRVVIDGTTTSIKNIDSEVVESNAPVYNLQGQRVDGNNLTPGIYVKAGKKFVIK
ncbi:Ig-like domain-containing protein [uncultured Prevotella sp.]|uniref:Ig-like domain-containing protein n=1 Tax=uncultured Prevotella sp. TaxID=159272 RepID=UPI0027E31243|nr:Ig-like domain-containing protein [uncultured Prevotella sp.]